MSEEMAVKDGSSSDVVKLNGEESGETAPTAATEASADPPIQDSEVPAEESPPEATAPESIPSSSSAEPVQEAQEDADKKPNTDGPQARKRRASSAFSDEGADDFRGFDQSNLDDSAVEYSRVLERIEAEVSAARENLTPLRNVTATVTPFRANKKMRQDPGTDTSRPSSGMSFRSDGEGLGTDACGSPVGRRRPTVELSSPLLRVPLDKGWKRELVHRANLDAYNRRVADIYYYTPTGKKLRSTREIAEHLSGTGLTLENFSFFKEPLGVDDPEKEIIRDAKMIRRTESPVPAAEGKRTPKPKAPKGASPEHNTHKSPPAKLKVKSVGSRLSTGSAAKAPPAKKTPAADNNNAAAPKKNSEVKPKSRLSNGAVTSPARRRGRAKPDDVDHFTAFYKKSQERNYNVVVQIFQYLGMRDVARAGRVSRGWRQLLREPALWRHVRMKNSHVSDWAGLCAALRRHGTKSLDLRKMLLPQNDEQFWEDFANHIHTVDSLERIELCRCPSLAVEACCRCPALTALGAAAVRSPSIDPEKLARAHKLVDLRIKSLAGLTLTRDLRPLSSLTALTRLSLTSIKELGRLDVHVLADLPLLEALELGECTFKSSFGSVLSRLPRLRRLRLERGGDAPALLHHLRHLRHLRHLELVNFDVKVGFDDALAECTNIQRLLIIPTYVSQSATTNKQVLSGVLRLKDTLTHLMWGVTIELLRVTELFIDQCDQGGDSKKKDIGECIPVLKPVPGCRLPDDHTTVAGPPQVEILPLPTLQRLLSAQLPNTKLKILRIPFHATWRQSLADFQ